MSLPQNKECSICGEDKPLSDYYTHGNRGLFSYCKLCHREKSLGAIRKRKYGLTIEQFHALWDEQGGKCAICSTELVLYAPRNEGNGHAIDHNHDTMEVRGILCQRCNTMLGMSGDSAAILQAGVNYLSKNGQYGRETTSRP